MKRNRAVSAFFLSTLAGAFVALSGHTSHAEGYGGEGYGGGGMDNGYGDGAWGQSDGDWGGSTDGGDGMAVDPPQPPCSDFEWDEENQVFRVEIVGSRSENTDGSGATEDESQTIEVIGELGGPITIFPVTSDHPNPGIDPLAIGFVGVDPMETGRPDEVLLVNVTTPEGRPVNAAVSPFMPLFLTASAQQNHTMIMAKLAEIGRIRNIAFRYTLVANLINQLVSYELAGLPIMQTTWDLVKENFRNIGRMIRPGGSMGAASLGFLARFNGIALSGYAGWWLGGQLYNRWAWLNEGGLDPVICAVRWYALGELDANCP
jgi:hypothetical protein